MQRLTASLAWHVRQIPSRLFVQLLSSMIVVLAFPTLSPEPAVSTSQQPSARRVVPDGPHELNSAAAEVVEPILLVPLPSPRPKAPLHAIKGANARLAETFVPSDVQLADACLPECESNDQLLDVAGENYPRRVREGVPGYNLAPSLPLTRSSEQPWQNAGERVVSMIARGASNVIHGTARFSDTAVDTVLASADVVSEAVIAAKAIVP
ncbi:hypothetical protein [Consotaella aegiceratis]|uniref:hypothetical protein n=1 Tax=Consotaella aegiceratis TaxID=3097961 RepID=UPI002F428348